MTFLLINGIGIFLIILVIWWFWFSKPKVTKLSDKNKVNDIIIDGGVYAPDSIQVPLNTPIVLRFIRKDASHCAEVVVFDGLNLSETIPLDHPKEITVVIKNPGTYSFHCPMGMYKGKLTAA